MKTTLALILAATLTLVGCQDKSADADAAATDTTAAVPAPAEIPAPVTSSASLIRVIGQDELPSEPGVGIVADGKISSTGKAGYLVYGPYAALNAGTYQVVLDGTVEALPEGAHATVDMVSNQGNSKLGSAEITGAPAAGAPLATFVATVPANATDVEVRVIVSETARVSVSGYRVQSQ